MPPKFKRHLNDDDVTGSVKSERRNLLEDDSDEEEDFFLRGPSGPRFGPRNDKIKHVQNQVDEVIDVMQENITKVIERGERLDELQDKSESLSDNATAFSNRAKQLRRQMWWRGCKIKAIMALVAVILLLVIIRKNDENPESTSQGKDNEDCPSGRPFRVSLKEGWGNTRSTICKRNPVADQPAPSANSEEINAALSNYSPSTFTLLLPSDPCCLLPPRPAVQTGSTDNITGWSDSP
ncbi:Vesicle-associated membrane protein 4 [Sciurus carolinensis]|uniref:Vesicle-associated membrane protein 4 n=1 Tax=Sciurus carolinensis TaxID=30640 RepID=A0AA41NCF1_SCICA|nr:Vesicle-associated membrane protein 4 [Sciurus carolinensis]